MVLPRPSSPFLVTAFEPKEIAQRADGFGILLRCKWKGFAAALAIGLLAGVTLGALRSGQQLEQRAERAPHSSSSVSRTSQDVARTFTGSSTVSNEVTRLETRNRRLEALVAALEKRRGHAAVHARDLHAR
jgi:hypothetical protein